MSGSEHFPRIARLSATISSQIAAGEVIERPSSVVKELVENSLDANTRNIDIDIEKGGTRFIRVRDDGYGIHPDDLLLALESHTTSKLRTTDDLERIYSLGFRGEALSSIATVSRFRITTRTQENEEGRCLDFDITGDIPDVSPAAHPVGTTVEVADLFQPVPARRKFLRSEKTEFLHILETVKRLALSRFDFSIRLRHNGKLVLSSAAVESDYRKRIESIIGNGFCRDALSIEYRSGNIRLWGWLGGDKTWRSQSDRQYFYVNGRAIRDKSVNHAVRTALEENSQPGRYPSYLLHMEIDSAAVDVNVHPTKQEVRFRQPRDIHDFIYTALRRPIEKPSHQVTLPSGNINTAQIYLRTSSSKPHRPIQEEAAMLYGKPDPASDETMPVLGRIVACLYDRFILCERGNGLILLDAVAARNYYLDFRFKKDIKNKSIKTRPLLVPLVIPLAARELQLLIDRQSLLSSVGLVVEQAGPTSIIVRHVPTLLDNVDLQAMLKDLLKGLALWGDGNMENLIAIFSNHGANLSLSMYSPRELAVLLRSLEETGLPLMQAKYPGIWRALNVEELDSMIRKDAG